MAVPAVGADPAGGGLEFLAEREAACLEAGDQGPGDLVHGGRGDRDAEHAVRAGRQQRLGGPAEGGGERARGGGRGVGGGGLGPQEGGERLGPVGQPGRVAQAYPAQSCAERAAGGQVVEQHSGAVRVAGRALDRVPHGGVGGGPVLGRLGDEEGGAGLPAGHGGGAVGEGGGGGDDREQPLVAPVEAGQQPVDAGGARGGGSRGGRPCLDVKRHLTAPGGGRGG